MAPLELIPLLEKQGLSWEMLRKKGRPLKGVTEKRRALVTKLHEAGIPWLEVSRLTCISLVSIQRLTQATENPMSRANRAERAARVGRAGSGRKKPRLSKSLRASDRAAFW